MRTLLIEDDPLIGDGIQSGLTKKGFSVDWMQDGELGQGALFSSSYDAVVLDLSLPGVDGITILQRWRNEGRVEPVIVLTARDAVPERVEGIRLGADDYLCKPFALDELAVRIDALIRRVHGRAQSTLTHGDIILDPQARTVTANGIALTLTPKEFSLLELLLRNIGRVMPRRLIEEKIYSWDEAVSSNSVEVHIHNLRKKLGNTLIRTVHGIGYTISSHD